MANLKPWYQVVTPREDLRENRPLDASEFAVHLDHIRERRANVHQDYLDPQRFFDRTYLTRSLLDLSAEAVRRLSGIQVETSAVFNMATQFGGGKIRRCRGPTTIWNICLAVIATTNGGRADARWPRRPWWCGERREWWPGWQHGCGRWRDCDCQKDTSSAGRKSVRR